MLLTVPLRLATFPAAERIMTLVLNLTGCSRHGAGMAPLRTSVSLRWRVRLVSGWTLATVAPGPVIALVKTVWAVGLTRDLTLRRLPTLPMKLVRTLNRGRKLLSVLIDVLHRPAGVTTWLLFLFVYTSVHDIVVTFDDIVIVLMLFLRVVSWCLSVLMAGPVISEHLNLDTLLVVRLWL